MFDEITINGITYNVPAEYSYYIVEQDSTLTLTRTGSVTLYSSLVEYGDNNSGYPRIQLQYGNSARLQTRSGNQTVTTNLVVSNWSIDHKNLLYDPLMNVYLTIILCGAAILRLFKS